jgi:hypothetical protein
LLLFSFGPGTDGISGQEGGVQAYPADGLGQLATGVQGTALLLSFIVFIQLRRGRTDDDTFMSYPFL